MPSYGQFCPMAKAMELLGERWTLLVVRELLLGSSHFNDLRRGVPKMSPGLLSKRLQTLIRVGVVERSEVDGRAFYRLTPSGHQLKEVVQALNDWGVRWTGELRDEDLDLRMLTWEIRRTIPIDAWPRKRTVLAFRMAGVAPKASSWWLMVAEGQADICDADPGYDISATITTSLRALTEIWRGHISWSRALLDGSISVDALADVRRDLPSWLGQKSAASVARPA
jgi:DNA-binding HxlR family transcriptional regulator